MTGVSKETIGCGLTRETQMHLRTLEESKSLVADGSSLTRVTTGQRTTVS